MKILTDLFMLAGGIAVFMLGLKFISENIELSAGRKLTALMRGVTKNRLSGVGMGALTTAVAQSSVATNMVVIGFVNSGAISFFDACGVVIGTNIGTTVTAQLVSLSFGGFNFTAIGFLAAFIGFIISLTERKPLKYIGNILIGFGLVFIGIKLMTDVVNDFSTAEWFKRIFLIKSGAILLLNGFFITAIFQSSSVVTSMLVILASSGLIEFSSCVYLILGANIGTCVAVILASAKKSRSAMQVAVFNILFNAFGALMFLPVMIFASPSFCGFFTGTGSLGRQVANFHSLFNLVVGIAVLPILKPFCKFTEKLVGKKSVSLKSLKKEKGKAAKKSNFC